MSVFLLMMCWVVRSSRMVVLVGDRFVSGSFLNGRLWLIFVSCWVVGCLMLSLLLWCISTISGCVVKCAMWTSRLSELVLVYWMLLSTSIGVRSILFR